MTALPLARALRRLAPTLAGCAGLALALASPLAQAAADAADPTQVPGVAAPAPLPIATPAPVASAPADGGTWANWLDDLRAARWEAGLTFGAITAYGFSQWSWGSSNFHFNSEHWFGSQTGSGGVDKLGHAFSSYAITNVVADKLLEEGRSRERAALSAALTSQAIMLWVEAFDGFSKDHGFAWQDATLNLAGTTLAYARVVNPALEKLVDYRVQYKPSGYVGFRPFGDYAGQKFLLAFKGQGVPALHDTPLGYLELQAGYYTRGFSKEERADGLSRSRHTFVGVGLNLGRLLFGEHEAGESVWKKGSRRFFEHVQVPGNSWNSDHRLSD